MSNVHTTVEEETKNSAFILVYDGKCSTRGGNYKYSGLTWCVWKRGSEK